MTEASLRNAVLRALDKPFPGVNMPASGAVLAAVSGGPDSMAMFHALCELSLTNAGLLVVVAHFDHQLRPDSHRDSEVIRAVAERYDVRVFTFRDDIARRARESGQSVETAARAWRYSCLSDLTYQFDSMRIATAHTRDDQVETVLMRILRGADATGLRGITAEGGGKLRPLLEVTHAETLAYCDANQVPYVLDPTNRDPRYFRNYVRHHVLPSLRSVYPGIDAALLRVRASALQQFEDNERATQGWLERFLRKERNCWRLSGLALACLEEDYQLHLLSRVVDTLGINDVTNVHYRAMLTGPSVDLPGWHVRHEQDGIVFMQRVSPVTLEPKPLFIPGTAKLADWNFTASFASGAQARATVETRRDDVVFIAANGPMTLRYPCEGDRMQPFGMKGHKKLSDIFIDRKIPRRMRATTPVVDMGGEVVWIPGIATSERCRIGAGSGPVVQLTATRSEA